MKRIAHFRRWRELRRLYPNILADLWKGPLMALREAVAVAIREPAVAEGYLQAGPLLSLGIAEGLGIAIAERRTFYEAVRAWRERQLLPPWCERPAAEECELCLEHGSDFPHFTVFKRPKLTRKPDPDPEVERRIWCAEGQMLSATVAEPAEEEWRAWFAAARAEKERREREEFKAKSPEQRRLEGPKLAQKRRREERQWQLSDWKGGVHFDELVGVPLADSVPRLLRRWRETAAEVRPPLRDLLLELLHALHPATSYRHLAVDLKEIVSDLRRVRDPEGADILEGTFGAPLSGSVIRERLRQWRRTHEAEH